jgi:anti-sigma B factor antagonist
MSAGIARLSGERVLRPMAGFEVTTSPQADRTLVALAGECDLSVSGELTSALLGALGEGREVVVDLAALQFLDSSGVHGLVTAYHAAKKDGVPLRLVNAGGVVADVLDLTGVGELLAAPSGELTQDGLENV